MKLSIEKHKPLNHSVMKKLQTARLSFKAPFRGVGVFLLLLVSVNLFAQVELNSTGSANAYVLSYPGAFSYTNGISFTFKANFANTASATINVNGLGAKSIKKHQGDNLAANDIKSGQVVTLVYDGTNFQMTSGLGNAPSGGGGGGAYWNETGSDIYNNNSGNVGIGMSSPAYKLDVGGDIHWNGDGFGEGGVLTSIGSSMAIKHKMATTSSGFALSQTSSGTTTTINKESGPGNIEFTVGGGIPKMVINNGGSVGIGTTFPNATLDVAGDVRWTNGGMLSSVGGRWVVKSEMASSSTGYGLSQSADGTTTNINKESGAGNIEFTVGGGIPKMVINNGGSVGIGTTSPNATLDVDGSVRLNTNNAPAGYVLTTDGNGNATWQTPSGGGGGGSGWNLTGNSGTNPSTDFVGTSDFQPLLFRVNNQFAGSVSPSTTNTSFGYGSYPGVSGSGNTAVGTVALLSNNGDENTAVGKAALNSNTGGSYNTALGSNALTNNSDGSENVALGVGAMTNNTTGTNNVAVGVQALNDAQTGTNNVAIGHHALQLTSSDAGYNVAVGVEALRNAQANFLSAIGYRALAENTYGTNNSALGAYALAANTFGSGNVAVGEEALSSNTSSDNNTWVTEPWQVVPVDTAMWRLEKMRS